MTPIFSLNETEALARKATRGADYSWGMAEEAGRAVRWLAGNGLDGARALDQLLRARDRGEADQCPLALGTAISDGALAVGPEGLNVSGLDAPILLIPFLVWTAARTGTALAVEIDGAKAVLGPKGPLALPGPQSCPARALRVTVTTSEAAGTPLQAGFRAIMCGETADSLARFAHRTYAPATDESRLSGAGAGLSDND